MDIKNTIISAEVVIESLIGLLENEGVDLSSIKFKIGSNKDGYESEFLSFAKLVDLTLEELNSAKIKSSPQWISVKDQLPPVDETVLVCWDYAADIEPDKEYLTLDEDYSEYWPNCQDEPPTHWIPIPKPPKEQSHDLFN